MKYRPRLPRKNVNVSHNNPFSEFLLLCFSIAAIFACIYWIIGLFVDVVAERISYENEAALFNIISSRLEVKSADGLVDRVRLQKLVDSLQSCTSLPYPVTVHVFELQEANAVALPGGHMAVFQGLLDALPDENGLAFVLAHELAHFENRDHLRSLGRSLVLFGLSAALTGGNSSLSNVLAPTSILSGAQYSQARESMADKKALDILDCKYGHVGKADDFFTYLLLNDDPGNHTILHYFSSHPQTKERLEALYAYARLKEYSLTPLR